MNALLRYARLAAAALLASAMLCGVASAQNEFVTPTAGKTVVGVGFLCLNSSGQMVPMFNASGTYQCAGTGLPVTGTFSATEKSTAAAPSYIEGSSNPLSGDLLGNLRTTMPSVGANGSTVKTNSSLMGVSDGTNQQQLVAPIALADGVNGNNMVAGGLYGYNGATWDRIRADITNGMWVQVKAGSGTRVEGTVTLGGTAQLVFSATPANGWEIINVHQTETLFVRENGTATAAYNAASTPILPGGSYTTPASYKPTGDVSVIAATTGHAFIARRW